MQHEKMCVIDEAIAFMGGFDLCFGRWDTAQHVLIDDGDMTSPEGSEYLWPGMAGSSSNGVCDSWHFQAKIIAMSG